MKTLLLTHPLPAKVFSDAVHSIEPQLPLLEYRPGMADAELAEVEAVLGWRFPDGVAKRLPRLRWVCSVGAGVDKLLVPELPAPVCVSRIVDAEQADGIAQFVVMMALRHARNLPAYEAQQRTRQWTRQPIGALRSHVGVLGMGAMGSAVARMLQAVGFQVTGYSRHSGQSLQSVLGSSDIVVCALPLTPQTQGLVDARALALMPRGSYLINIARGAHVVEPDLIDAVRSGHLAGAALDVQQHEPLPADDPLWDVPGITITPHIAAQSSPHTIALQFVQGWRCLQRGEAPHHLVDRERGY
ncbi:MAG: glyoxylate/hydroxypyruvate reductase A [Burkholderiaceae bacterium]|nr:glyoxylate/hydroxypyruvate reductase A [Burkholderiaceae bacterium]